MRCPRCHRRIDPRRGCDAHGGLGLAAPEALPAAPPARLPGVADGAALAVGGSAVVFAAGADEVVKWGRWRDADLHHRFAHEAAVLDALGGAVAPRRLDHGAVDGWPYLRLERLHGRTLATALTTVIADPIACWRALVTAVATLHARGVIHGDLKPENAIVGDAVRVLDFGLASLDGVAAPAAVGAGTLHYTAPEQLAAEPITAAVDVYALGVIGFELCTGRAPFVGDRATIEYGHQLGRPPRARELAAMAPELDALLDACLAKRPSRRPTAAALAAALGAVASPIDPVAATAPTATRRERGPVALTWIATRDRVGAARVITAHRGRLVREQADGTLAAFAWVEHDAPLVAALAVARELAVDGAAIAVHAATLECRQRGTSLRLLGEAVERASWIPAHPWTGVLLTAAVRAPEVDGADCATHPGYRRLVEAGGRHASSVHTVPELVARDGLVIDVTAALAAALDDGRPALVTIVGAAGAGKTRVLDELATVAAARGWTTVRVGGAPLRAGRGQVGAALAARLGHDAPLPALRGAAERGVVVLIDDAHWIEDETLDALATATGWTAARLAVVVTATEALATARPSWGDDHLRYALRPLDDDAAHRLVRRLLLPAVRVPTPLVARLAARARGNPGALVAIARELHGAGVVRRHPDSDEWYLAAEEVDAIVLEPDVAWRAARALAALPAGLAALYRTVALLGPRFDADEVAAVVAAQARGDAEVDADAGVAWLVRHAWLTDADGALAVTAPALGEAAAAQLDDDRRAEIHRAAFAHWAARGDEVAALERLAHHGPGCGERARAGHAFATLAETARARVGYVEAERLATRAVELLDGIDPLAAARARLTRAQVRAPLSRFEAARGDLATARATADAHDDLVLAIEALIADAAVCDFADWMAESAAAAETAAALAPPSLPPATAARLCNWLGVVRERQARHAEGEALLERARELADAVGEHAVAVGSRFMLGALRRRRGDAASGLALVDEALAMCRARGDVFHESVGLFNRINYSIALGAPAQAAADCAAAIELAACHGYGDAEFRGWCNLANVRVQLGDDDGARTAARRAYDVARRRFGKHPPVVAALILAALEAGTGELATAAALVDVIDRAEAAANPWTETLLAAVELTVASAGDGWAAIDAVIARSQPEDRALLAWLRARAA